MFLTPLRLYPDITTDMDSGVEAIVAHEYFHNCS